MIWTATTGMRERLLWAWKTKPSDKTFRRKTYLPKACNFHVQMPGSLNWRTKHARKMFTRCGLAPAGWLRDGFDFRRKLTCPKHVIFMSKCLEVLTGERSMPGKCLRDVALGQLAGCEMGLTLESEEGEVPHLRWSQAPPLPWPRPGSADFVAASLAHQALSMMFFCETIPRWVYPRVINHSNRK